MWQKIILCLWCLFLGGCGAVPQPFRADISPLTERPIRGTLVVPLIQNMGRIDPGDLKAEAISTCIISALIAREIPAAQIYAGEASSYLQGKLLRYQNGIGIFEWQLHDAYSGNVHRFNTHIDGISNLDYQPNNICQSVAEQATLRLNGDKGQLLDQKLAAGRLKVKKAYVTRISGVTEEKERAMFLLFTATARRLKLPLAENIESADYFIQADIQVTDLPNEDKNVTFIWRLLSKQGVELGDMAQGNRLTVAQERDWKSYYPIVARDAARGMHDLLQQIGRALPISDPESPS